MRNNSFFPRKSYLALSVSAAITLTGAGNFALAQDTAEESVEDLEEVVVTGSRIRRQDFVANSPIVTVDQSTFEETSTIGLDTVLNQLPQFIPGAVGTHSGTVNQGANEAQQFGTGGSQFAAGGIVASAYNTPGTSTVNLRGLGAGRNLVLIDGRRGMPVNATMTVDTNTIPSSAVERIEIVSGGASAVYGADAVAGAVNFILKDDFEGLEINTNYGLTALGDAEEYRISGLFGANTSDGRGNVMIGLEHASRDTGDFNERDWYLEMREDPRLRGTQLFPYDTWVGFDTASFGSPGLQAAVDSVFPELDPGTLSTFLNTFAINKSDGTVYSGGSFFGTSYGREGAYKYNGPLEENGFPVRKLDPLGGIANNQEVNWISVPLERYTAFAKGTYDITDNVSAFANINFSRSQTRTANQYTPAVTGWGVWIPKGDNVYLDSLADPGAAVTYAPDGSVATVDPAAATLPQYQSGGTFGLNCPAVGGCTNNQAFPMPAEMATIANAFAGDSIRISRVLDFLGERQTLNTSTNYQFMIGAEGETDSGYYWDVSLTHGESETTTQILNSASLSRYREVASAPNFGRNFVAVGNEQSGNNWGASEGTCTSGLPLFEEFEISQDCIDSIGATIEQLGLMKQDTFDANFGGDIFDMPAGTLAFNVGLAYRKNHFTYKTSDNNKQGGFQDQPIGFYPMAPTDGKIPVKELYGEILVPLVSGGPSGMKEVNLELGGRISDYYDTSGKVNTAKALVDWLITDTMRFRGGYQKATRAPNISELFAGRTREVWASASSYGDVCSLANYDTSLSAAVGPHPDDGDPAPATAGQAAQTRAICESMMGATAANAYYNEVDFDDMPDPGAGGQPWVSGNPTIQPETADTWTAGLVITSPSESPWLSGMTLSIDYFQIELEDMIAQIGSDLIFDRCFDVNLNTAGDPNNIYCQKITRNPETGGSLSMEVTYNNESTATLAGIDLNLNWTAQLADLGFDSVPGGLGINLLATIPTTVETQLSADSDTADWVGHQSGSGCPSSVACGTYAYQLFTTFNYFNGPWSTSLRWQHYPDIDSGAKVTNSESTAFGVHDAYNVFALTGSYRLDDNITLMGGIENLFDAKPPKAGGDPDASNWPVPATYAGGGIYDVLGRRFYVSANFSF